MDKFGNLQVDTDPNLPYYPPTHTDLGQLIGFQNNFTGTIYSLSFRRSSTNPSQDPANVVCTEPNATWRNASNVRIVNIPWPNSFLTNPGYSYYFDNVPPYGHTCDAVFSPGVPKGGSTYFALSGGGAVPNFPRWIVTAKTVVPFVSFPSAIVKNQTATGNVTLYPSPSPVSVTLNLTTISGTGSAVFASTNNTTMIVSQSGSVDIKGVDASSAANNIEFRASVNNEVRSQDPFSVIWVTISTMRTSGTLSADNDAKNAYVNATGTQNLDGNGAAVNGVEINAVVTPNDFSEPIALRQTLISAACYKDALNGSTPDDCGQGWGSSYSCGSANYVNCVVDIQGGSNDPLNDATPSAQGNIYLWDTPGTRGSSITGTTNRIRQNFAVFAVYNGVVASDVFTWSNASSAINQNGTVTWENTFNSFGDNRAAQNLIKTSFDLQQ